MIRYPVVVPRWRTLEHKKITALVEVQTHRHQKVLWDLSAGEVTEEKKKVVGVVAVVARSFRQTWEILVTRPRYSFF